MSMNPALALSVVKASNNHVIDQGREYYDGIVNFLDSEESLCEQSVCGSDGIDRPNVRDHDRKIETVFGIVSTSRAGYGNEGVAILHPLDAELKSSF